MNVGDNVGWTSQANGRTKHKEGTVVHVLPAHADPMLFVNGNWDQYVKNSSYGFRRNHESYLVAVPATGTGRPKLYWPVVSQLRVLETADATE